MPSLIRRLFFFATHTKLLVQKVICNEERLFSLTNLFADESISSTLSSYSSLTNILSPDTGVNGTATCSFG